MVGTFRGYPKGDLFEYDLILQVGYRLQSEEEQNV